MNRIDVNIQVFKKFSVFSHLLLNQHGVDLLESAEILAGERLLLQNL